MFLLREVRRREVETANLSILKLKKTKQSKAENQYLGFFFFPPQKKTRLISLMFTDVSKAAEY